MSSPQAVGFLLNRDASSCLAYFSLVSEIIIPDTVKETGDCCYYQLDLQCVTFGTHSQVQRIGSEVFFAASIQLSGERTSTVLQVFYGCERLTSVTFGQRSERNVLVLTHALVLYRSMVLIMCTSANCLTGVFSIPVSPL